MRELYTRGTAWVLSCAARRPESRQLAPSDIPEAACAVQIIHRLSIEVDGFNARHRLRRRKHLALGSSYTGGRLRLGTCTKPGGSSGGRGGTRTSTPIRETPCRPPRRRDPQRLVRFEAQIRRRLREVSTRATTTASTCEYRGLEAESRWLPAIQGSSAFAMTRPALVRVLDYRSRAPARRRHRCAINRECAATAACEPAMGSSPSAGSYKMTARNRCRPAVDALRIATLLGRHVIPR